MRVITGSARGKKLATPQGLETRPTAEMVKEAVFSMIQFEIEGANVLDLFAGSGQMGIEALSRGAASCVFVDNSRDAYQAITQNLNNTDFADKSRIVRSDALSWVKTAAGQFDIVFLDPPYNQKLAENALPFVGGLMRDSGVIICETSKGEELPELSGDFKKYREYRYGKTVIVQYRKAEE